MPKLPLKNFFSPYKGIIERIDFSIIKLIIFCLFLYSCHSVDPHSKPSNLIPKNLFKSILIDFYLADAYANSGFDLRFQEQVKLSKYSAVLKLIFSKYSISKEQFESSLDYYLYNDNDLHSLYEDMFKELTLEKNKLLKDSIAFRKKDSILHPEKRIRALKTKDSLTKLVKELARKQKIKDSLNQIKLNKKLKKIHSLKLVHP